MPAAPKTMRRRHVDDRLGLLSLQHGTGDLGRTGEVRDHWIR